MAESSSDSESPDSRSMRKPKTLQQSSEDRIISTLAKSIECYFSCEGTVPEVNSASILYKKQCGDWSSRPLQLPVDLSTGEIPKEFLEACSAASFGIGGETVTDKDYRDALKLDPECFRADFELENTSILSTIASIMHYEDGGLYAYVRSGRKSEKGMMDAVLSRSSIRAKLYKLNVYSTGGHFKAHVDTPQSPEMFGSL